MAHRTKSLPALLASALLATGCSPQVQGNGVYREEPRTVQPFAGIQVQDGKSATDVRVAAHVTCGSPQSVRVIGDANIVQSIETQVEPTLVGTSTFVSVLRVWVTGSYQATIPPAVVVTVPSIEFARAEDGTQVEVKKAQGTSIRVEGATGGAVTLIGPGGPFLEADLSDASLDAAYYPVSGAWVELTGASRADLNSSGAVIGTAAGTSVVDNSLNAGPCYVATTGSARTVCH